MTGLQRTGRTYRFLTLTLGPEFTASDFQRAWHVLIARLRRRRWVSAYIRVLERGLEHGSLHAHVIITGSYIDRWLLVKWWEELTGQWNVDIRRTQGERHNMAAELAGYMAKDPDARLAYSWSWAWPALAGTWSWYLRCARLTGQLGRVGFPSLVDNWARCAASGIPPPQDLKSCRLIGFLLPGLSATLPLPPKGYLGGWPWSSYSILTSATSR